MNPLFLLVILFAASDEGYRHVPIPDLPKNVRTHVCTTGKVEYVRKQADGDYHIKITDGKAFVVAEEIPTLKPTGKRPRKGQTVTVCGITRYDRQHKWEELHPIQQYR